MKELAVALVKCQGMLGNVIRDSKNPHYKSTYASLEAVIDALKGPLTECGLAVVQSIEGDVLSTKVIHTNGESLETNFPLIVSKQDMQGLASAHTYARRYSLLGLFCMGAEDDDGNAAVTPSKGVQADPPKPHVKIELPKPIIKEVDIEVTSDDAGEITFSAERYKCYSFYGKPIKEVPRDLLKKVVGSWIKGAYVKKIPMPADLVDMKLAIEAYLGEVIND